MNEQIRNLLHQAYLLGFEHGLNPGDAPDGFEQWYDSVAVEAFLLAGEKNNGLTTRT